MDDDIRDRADRLAAETVLTPRRAEVQAYLEAGYTRREIADELDLSPNTIDEHRREIKRVLREAERTVEELDTPA